MSLTLLRNVRALLPDGRIEPCSARFDSLICAIVAIDEPAMPAERIVDGQERLLTPGLIDLHTHGIGRNAYERSPEDLLAGLAMLPSFGVTTVLPTLYRSLRPDSFPLLERLAAVLDESRGAKSPGFHLEGPFLAIAGAGAMTMDADLVFLDELLSACQQKVAAMSISPEVVGIVSVIERLRERGVVPFITHTRASPEQTQAAIDAGARHATHFYDVFPAPPEVEAGVRPVGAVEVLLADPRVTVDFICDGVHVHPAAIRMALAAKGIDGVVAITDSNVGAGLPDGTYDTPWGYRVDVGDGDAARVADVNHPQHGLLAGSALTMNKAVENLSRWLPARDAIPWRMATQNPARVLGLTGRGAIKESAAADLVLWNADLTPHRTWVGGELVYTDERKN